ncbi:MAG: outer membrane beta-barrel protein [Bacteroidetes bacterium]|nr:outer membrane beta-barrel protein [Bacteroidota bacterium]
MKTLLFILFGFFAINLLRAQDTASTGKDTAHLKIGKMNFLMWEDPSAELDTSSNKKKKGDDDHGRIPLFGIGINGYLNARNSSALPKGYEFLELRQEKSLSVNFNILEGDIDLIKNYLYIVLGADIEFNNYRFTGSNRISGTGSVITGFTDTIALKKSKLTATYLTFPLLLEINTRKKYSKALHILPGMIYGIKIGSHSKLVYDAGGITYKPKEYGDFNMAPFRYGLTLRIGYRGVQFFANYMLSELFEDIKDPLLYPFSAGIMLF